MNTLNQIKQLLTLCHKRFPTEIQKHNLTLEKEYLKMTIFYDNLWHSFLLEEKDMLDLEETVDFLERYINGKSDRQ